MAIDVVDITLSPFLIQIILIFMLAGLVKGVVGFGLPTIGIGLGALISDIPTAMMLILVPTFFTNIVQIFGTGSLRDVLQKSWMFLLGAVLLVPLRLWMVVVVPEFPFERLLGLLILVYSLASLKGFNPVMQMKNNSCARSRSWLIEFSIDGYDRLNVGSWGHVSSFATTIERRFVVRDGRPLFSFRPSPWVARSGG